jgi:hypothetical protein
LPICLDQRKALIVLVVSDKKFWCCEQPTTNYQRSEDPQSKEWIVGLQHDLCLECCLLVEVGGGLVFHGAPLLSISDVLARFLQPQVIVAF